MFNLKENTMKRKEIWKFVVQTLISVLTALGAGQAKQGSLDEFTDCDDVDAVGGGSCEASGTSALWGE